MLNELWGQNAFYTEKLKGAGFEPRELRSLEDVARLPLTLKSELAADQAEHPRSAGI